MDVEKRTVEDATVVAFVGSLDTNTAQQAHDALDAVIDEGGRKIVVDFLSVDYISSSGLRILLATAKRLNADGGVLGIFGLNETVNEVFEISGFDTIFNVFGSESDAIAGIG